jgi:chromosome segregation ATPase
MDEITRKEELIRTSDTAKSHLQEELHFNSQSLELEKQTTQNLRIQLEDASKQFEQMREQLEENRNQVTQLGQQIESEKKQRLEFSEELEMSHMVTKQLEELVRINQTKGEKKMRIGKINFFSSERFVEQESYF